MIIAVSFRMRNTSARVSRRREERRANLRGNSERGGIDAEYPPGSRHRVHRRKHGKTGTTLYRPLDGRFEREPFAGTTRRRPGQVDSPGQFDEASDISSYRSCACATPHAALATVAAPRRKCLFTVVSAMWEEPEECRSSASLTLMQCGPTKGGVPSIGSLLPDVRERVGYNRGASTVTPLASIFRPVCKCRPQSKPCHTESHRAPGPESAATAEEEEEAEDEEAQEQKVDNDKPRRRGS